MNELQRVAYSQALDIDCYIPRRLLPNAPEPVRCEISLVASGNALAGNDVSSSAAEGLPELTPYQPSQSGEHSLHIPTSTPAANTPASSSISSALEILNDKPAVASSQTEAPSASLADHTKNSSKNDVATLAEKAAEQSDTVKNNGSLVPLTKPFSLHLWRVSIADNESLAADNTELLIFDSRQPSLALPTEGFLANVLHSVGLLPDNTLPAPSVIRWPVNESAINLLNVDDTREMLMTYFESQSLDQAALKMLVWGEEASAFMTFESKSIIGSCCDVPGLKASALVLPSLSDCLQNPSLKAKVWRDLVSYIYSDVSSFSENHSES